MANRTWVSERDPTRWRVKPFRNCVHISNAGRGYSLLEAPRKFLKGSHLMAKIDYLTHGMPTHWPAGAGERKPLPSPKESRERQQALIAEAKAFHAANESDWTPEHQKSMMQ